MTQQQQNEQNDQNEEDKCEPPEDLCTEIIHEDKENPGIQQPQIDDDDEDTGEIEEDDVENDAVPFMNEKL